MVAPTGFCRPNAHNMADLDGSECSQCGIHRSDGGAWHDGKGRLIFVSPDENVHVYEGDAC